MQEVRILKGVRHPNVLFFRGICLTPPMIITELCEHGSVNDVINLTVRMSQPNSTLMLGGDKRAMLEEHMAWIGRVRLMLDAAKGMLYLHSKDLLHCDLKSLNLLVDKAWTCKVADFGLSRCAPAFHPLQLVRVFQMRTTPCVEQSTDSPERDYCIFLHTYAPVPARGRCP